MKREGENFSDVVRRLTTGVKLTDYQGVLSESMADDLEDAIAVSRRKRNDQRTARKERIRAALDDPLHYRSCRCHTGEPSTSQWERRLEAEAIGVVTAMSVMELWQGIHLSRVGDPELATIQSLLEGLHHADFDRAAAMTAGELAAE